jgi:hypothetical protein
MLVLNERQIVCSVLIITKRQVFGVQEKTLSNWYFQSFVFKERENASTKLRVSICSYKAYSATSSSQYWSRLYLPAGHNFNLLSARTLDRGFEFRSGHGCLSCPFVTCVANQWSRKLLYFDPNVLNRDMTQTLKPLYRISTKFSLCNAPRLSALSRCTVRCHSSSTSLYL